MGEFKPSSLIIVLVIFIASMATSASWIAGIKEEYPSANISADWNETFNKMSNINQTSESIYETFGSGDQGIEETQEGALGLWAGTTTAIKNAWNVLTLIPTLISDFTENFSNTLPWWFRGTLWTIILISVSFTIAGLFLRARP